MVTEFSSLSDLMIAFQEPQAAIDHFTAIRWRNGQFCPYCNHPKVYKLTKGSRYKCASPKCRRLFSITVGTIFENTKLPLRIWFGAMWLITNHKKGIASTTLATDLNITQKAAWFVLHRLRYAARLKSFNKPLTGIVEVDETFIGGKAKSRHGRRSGARGTEGKTPVLGAVQRDGAVIAMVNNRSGGLGWLEAQDFIEATVSPDAELLVTDAHQAFKGLQGYPQHQIVNHYRGEHRKGIAHTNTIESVWALLKRQINGTHHWVSPKHLQQYVSEMAWRMSRRDMTAQERVNAICTAVEGRLTYKVLTA